MPDTPIRDCEVAFDEETFDIHLNERLEGDSDSDVVATCAESDNEPFREDAMANGKRLAACWNLMAGIPTEDLATLLELAAACAEVCVSDYPEKSPTAAQARRLLRLCDARKAAT